MFIYINMYIPCLYIWYMYLNTSYALLYTHCNCGTHIYMPHIPVPHIPHSCKYISYPIHTVYTSNTACTSYCIYMYIPCLYILYICLRTSYTLLYTHCIYLWYTYLHTSRTCTSYTSQLYYIPVVHICTHLTYLYLIYLTAVHIYVSLYSLYIPQIPHVPQIYTSIYLVFTYCTCTYVPHMPCHTHCIYLRYTYLHTSRTCTSYTLRLYVPQMPYSTHVDSVCTVYTL